MSSSPSSTLTKSMTFKGSYKSRCKTVVQDKLIEFVNIFLGREISYSSEMNAKILKVSGMSWTVKSTLRNKKWHALKRYFVKFYKFLAIPAGLCRNETWNLILKNRSRIQATEMIFFSSILGVTKLDRLRNDDGRKHSCNTAYWNCRFWF